MPNKECQNCVHYESVDPNYGECRFDPPRVVPDLLIRRTVFFSSMSPMNQSQSKLWPMMGSTEHCDRHTD